MRDSNYSFRMSVYLTGRRDLVVVNDDHVYGGCAHGSFLSVRYECTSRLSRALELQYGVSLAEDRIKDVVDEIMLT